MSSLFLHYIKTPFPKKIDFCKLSLQVINTTDFRIMQSHLLSFNQEDIVYFNFEGMSSKEAMNLILLEGFSSLYSSVLLIQFPEEAQKIIDESLDPEKCQIHNGIPYKVEFDDKGILIRDHNSEEWKPLKRRYLIQLEQIFFESEYEFHLQEYTEEYQQRVEDLSKEIEKGNISQENFDKIINSGIENFNSKLKEIGTKALFS